MLFDRLLAASPEGARTLPGPFDDYWYRDEPALDVDVAPTAATALTESTVYRGVSVLSNTLAMLPLPVLERLPDEEGTRKAREHRLWRVLHDRPNRWQTSFTWRQVAQAHLVLRGNAYNRIVSDRRRGGFATELIPLHPSRTRAVRQLSDGRIVYEHQRRTGGIETLVGGEDMFHLKGFSDDGITGLSVIALMRRALAGAINTESFAAKLFAKAPLMRGFLKYPKKLDVAAREALEKSFARSAAGKDNWHSTPVLEGGMEWQEGGMMSAEDSQFIQTRNLTIPVFARFIGVPTVLLMHADKTALYANAEQFFQSFLNFDIAHWFANWEQGINQTLFLPAEQPRFFCEFTRDAIIRGDLKARGMFYKIMVELGVFTPNEVRVLEGKNKLAGLDEPAPRSGGRPAARPAAARQPPAAAAPSARLQTMVETSSARLVTKEIAALRRAATRYAANDDHYRKAVGVFYEKFTAEVERSLAISPADAAAWTARRRAELLTSGNIKILETWEQDAGARLAGQTIGVSQ